MSLSYWSPRVALALLVVASPWYYGSDVVDVLSAIGVLVHGLYR
ncbi:MAG: hypothetical protein ACRD21_23485 [Vicinamibacteria bacterium]